MFDVISAANRVSVRRPVSIPWESGRVIVTGRILSFREREFRVSMPWKAGESLLLE